MKWRNVYRGFMMGVSDLVPGISGGTIAVLLGIYDRLIAAINGFFSRDWRTHFLFLFPLVIGMAIALFSLSHLMKWLLGHHPHPTYYFFIGLIVGVLPFLFHKSKASQRFRLHHLLLMALSIILISMMPIPESGEVLIEERSVLIYSILFISGFFASAAMILPGISGSFVLVLIGTYDTIIYALSELEWFVIFIVGFGIVLGIILMSKLIHYFFYTYETASYAIIIGLVIGSIGVIVRRTGFDFSSVQLVFSGCMFLIGLLIAYLLGKVEYDS